MTTKGTSKAQRIDWKGTLSLTLAFIAIFGAAIIAALGFGGVINMGTVKVFLVAAWFIGACGICTAGVWLHRWLREGVRVAASMLASGMLAAGLYALYFWIGNNSSMAGLNSTKSPEIVNNQAAESPSLIRRALLHHHTPQLTHCR